MKRLLIADDDSEMRDWLSLVLRRTGAEIAEAADGVELSRMLRTDRYSLVLTDLRMPGKSGLQAALEASAAGISPPILLLTGYDDDAARALASSLPNVLLLRKPIDAQTLLDTIRRLLEAGSEAP